MRDLLKTKNDGQLTVAAWTLYGALASTQSTCLEVRKNIVKRELGYQKNNFSTDILKTLELKYSAVCGDNLTLKDCIDIAHNRQPKGINIPSNHLGLFAISNDTQKER